MGELQNEQHVDVRTLHDWSSACQPPSRAVTPCMFPVALDELHLFLFALFMPPATHTFTYGFVLQ